MNAALENTNPGWKPVFAQNSFRTWSKLVWNNAACLEEMRWHSPVLFWGREGHSTLVSFHRSSELNQMKMLVLASSYLLETLTHSCKQFEGTFRIRGWVHLPAQMNQKPFRDGRGCTDQVHRHIIWSCYHFCAALNMLQISMDAILLDCLALFLLETNICLI